MLFSNETFQDTDGNIRNTRDITGIQLVQDFTSARQLTTLDVASLQKDDVDFEMGDVDEAYFNVEINKSEWLTVDSNSTFHDELLEKYLENL